MENSFENVPSKEPVEPVLEEKKPFLTIGKIIAIFGVLLIVGTIVGAVMYSRSSERFKGDIITTHLAPSVDTSGGGGALPGDATNEVVDQSDVALIDKPIFNTGDLALIKPSDELESSVEMNDSILQGGNALQEVEMAPNIESSNIIPNLTQPGITHDDVPVEMLPQCDAPFMPQTYENLNYCMCADGEYPAEFMEGASGLYSCDPFSCDLTNQDLEKIKTDIGNILNGQGFGDIDIARIQTKFASDYDTYKQEKCSSTTQPEVSCDDLKAELDSAYYARNWSKYNEILVQMSQKNCPFCDILFYKIVGILSQDVVNQDSLNTVNGLIDDYIAKQCDECKSIYGIIALYANALSEYGGNVQEANLDRLKKLVEKYINDGCINCDGFGSFLQNLRFKPEDYFAGTNVDSVNLNRDLLQTSDLNPNLPNTIPDQQFSPGDFGDLFSSINIRTAYAQSGTLSQEVKEAIESVYEELCPGPDDQDTDSSTTTTTTTTTTTQACRSLEITAPSEAARPGVPTIVLPSGRYVNEPLRISVDTDSGVVTDYRYRSANGYITFKTATGIPSNPLDTTSLTVLMNGVVPEGRSEEITVWARDGQRNGIPDCNDGYVVTVPTGETPPPTEETPPPTEQIPVTTTTVTTTTPVITTTPITSTTPVAVTTPTTTTAPLHGAAPESPETGPGVLIYLVGAGLGGALLRRKK